MVKFGNTKKFTKPNIANISNDQAVIYKIKNDKGNNLYTGIAGRGRAQERLLEHKNNPEEKIPGGTRIQVAFVKTKEVAAKEEKRIIKAEQPKFNEQEK